ncbi:hypothetical protein [Spirilliplanes yamanashiensis]|uniref:Uncharacterized protein n=1 Tax=Spirilliplanes yamanashiensis TaxID=42233 RepID=A0A8J4DGV3_9ACTN|nr:hypothetical protein [Spirilliplanes yamanashiensis]MDP9819531.1 hypothetical protein [Spirilliplanes yamanashiensis]GIJ01647.1 hypothetical protein Sya03_09990 [Spirilliplanes yamanashiensis]
MQDDRTSQQRVESELRHGAYGDQVLDDSTDTPEGAPQSPADVPELKSTIDADVDPEVLRNGGPTRTPGMMTTTGGNAGPNSIKRHPNRPTDGTKVANTTTGDATTGGFTSEAGGTSDASTAI